MTLEHILDYLIIVVLVLGLLIINTRSIEATIRYFAVQSFFLVALTSIMAYNVHQPEMYWVAIMGFLGKCIIVPLALLNIVSKLGLRKINDMMLPSPNALLLGGVLMVLSFYLVSHLHLPPDHLELMSVGISLMIIGLLHMLNSKNALGQIMGLYLLDNGIFTITIATVFEMPLIVEMGIFLELVIGLIVLGAWIYRLKRTFNSLDLDKLRSLRG